MKNIITTPGFRQETSTIEYKLGDKIMRIFVLETAKSTYKAHTLDGLLNLWKQAGDESAVLNVGRIYRKDG